TFAHLAEQAEAHLADHEAGHWLDVLQQEHDNLRAALRWSLQHDPDVALRLGAALWQFWFARGHLSEGRSWLRAVLGQSSSDDVYITRAKASTGASVLATFQADYAEAIRLGQDGLLLFRQLHIRPGIANSLVGLAFATALRGGYDQAEALARESIAI